MLVFGVVVGVSVSTHAALVQEPVTVMERTVTDVLAVIAQTTGMDRRQDRRDTRQDCRREHNVGRRRGQAQLQTAGTLKLICSRHSRPRHSYKAAYKLRNRIERFI